MPLVRGDDGVYRREKHTNGRMPPNPYTANKALYGNLTKTKKPKKINWTLVKIIVLGLPLLMGLYSLFFRT